MKNFPNFFVIILISLQFQACQCWKTKNGFPENLPIGKKVTLKGYLSGDPMRMVVYDSIWLTTNAPMAKNQYLLLVPNPVLDSFVSKNYQHAFGIGVTIKGTVVIGKGGRLEGLKVIESNSIEENASSSGSGPDPIIVDLNNSLFLPTVPTVPNKFALLYSGGINQFQAKNRYWNDLAFMYNTLKCKYGYSDDNILVVYKDGVAPAGNDDMIVDFPASATGLSAAIESLTIKMNANPDDNYLFVFTTNHGGGYRIPPFGSPSMKSGMNDNNNDENHESPMVDESIFYYINESSANPPVPSPQTIMRDEQFAFMINQLPCKQIITVGEQCFSGGMLRDFITTGGGTSVLRINIAAAPEYDYSYSYPTLSNQYDAFSYLFTAALFGANYNGSVLAETPANYDSLPGTTVWEAYWYAKNNDQLSEHPFDDNGDGIGRLFSGASFVKPTGNDDGAFASGIML